MAVQIRANGLPIDPDEVIGGLPAGSSAGQAAQRLAMALWPADLVGLGPPGGDEFADPVRPGQHERAERR
jgi:hypothetical protein